MTEITYREFTITRIDPPVPSRKFDYEAAHVEYSGPEDQLFHGESIADCMDQIDEWYEENTETV